MFLEAGQAAAQNAGLQSLLMLIIMIAILYFFAIRPQKKREKEIQDMRDSLKIGDEIITIGGIEGKIVVAKDDYIVIEVKPHRTQMQLAKWSIAKVIKESKAKEEIVETDEPDENIEDDSQKNDEE